MMNKDKKEVINTVKQEIEVVIEDCEYLAMLAKHSLAEFDDFESERTLIKLDLMLDEIKRVNSNVLNWDEFLTKMHEKGATPYLQYIKNKAGV